MVGGTEDIHIIYLYTYMHTYIHTLGIKTTQKPYIVWSLGPNASIYESLDS